MPYPPTPKPKLPHTSEGLVGDRACTPESLKTNSETSVILIKHLPITVAKTMSTIYLREAAALLKIHPQTLLQKVRARKVPGAKPGKCWVFIEDDLFAWLRSA